MTRNILLEIEKPWIDCYTNYAHLLSILQCDKRTYGWIFSNFILMFINKELNKNSWGEFYRPMPYEARSFDLCKWINVQKIRREMVTSDRDKFLEFIQNEMREGYYIHLNIDHKYIRSFKTNNHWHDALIYGINYDEDKVYMQGVFCNGKYTRESISIGEFLEAVIRCDVPANEDYMNGMINFYRINKEIDYEFNDLNIWKSIKFFGDSSVPEYWQLYNNSNKGNIAFGLDIYSALKRYINVMQVEAEHMDIRPFYYLLDHCIIMKKCIEWLRDNCHREDIRYDEIIDLYDKMIKTSNEINISLIYIIKSHKDKRDKIYSLLDYMVQQEKNIQYYLP